MLGIPNTNFFSGLQIALPRVFSLIVNEVEPILKIRKSLFIYIHSALHEHSTFSCIAGTNFCRKLVKFAKINSAKNFKTLIHKRFRKLAARGKFLPIKVCTPCNSCSKRDFEMEAPSVYLSMITREKIIPAMHKNVEHSCNVEWMYCKQTVILVFTDKKKAFLFIQPYMLI